MEWVEKKVILQLHLHTPVTPPIAIDSSTAVLNQDPGMKTGGGLQLNHREQHILVGHLFAFYECTPTSKQILPTIA